jgi:hypothetical protein
MRSAPAVLTHPGAGHPEVAGCRTPTVREMLLARIDELVRRMGQDLEKVRAVTEQLHPERARSCRNAITMASVVDEIRLRAHARPLDETEP